MRNNHKEYDIIVVGGGISGLAVAYGLCKNNEKFKIAVIDSPTEINKASRTNVGLLWCQSKFLHEPDFARWGFLSCKLFPKLVDELQYISKIEIPVNFTGGLIPTLGEAEFTQRETYIYGLKKALGEYPGTMLSRSELEQKLPKIKFGEEVSGAAWCEEDGVVEPLLLLRAYRIALEKLGVDILEDTIAYEVKPQSKEHYHIMSSRGQLSCSRVVLAAGLANRRLTNFAFHTQDKSNIQDMSNMQGTQNLQSSQGVNVSDVSGVSNSSATFNTTIQNTSGNSGTHGTSSTQGTPCAGALPIFADKGQVLLTERLPYVMPIPILGCTQTFGGTVIIGFKHETRGHDATVVPEAVSQEGAWAMRVWPELATKRIIRSWPGLRVMPDDKVAIYSHLPHHPNVTVINTHSAVTLAAVHSLYLSDYIMGGNLHECASNMTLKRFGFDC